MHCMSTTALCHHQFPYVKVYGSKLTTKGRVGVEYTWIDGGWRPGRDLKKSRHEVGEWAYSQLCLLFYRCYLCSRQAPSQSKRTALIPSQYPLKLPIPSPSKIEPQPLTTRMPPAHLLRRPRKIMSEDPTPPTKNSPQKDTTAYIPFQTGLSILNWPSKNKIKRPQNASLPLYPKTRKESRRPWSWYIARYPKIR